jgi:hypothetical protein
VNGPPRCGPVEPCTRPRASEVQRRGECARRHRCSRNAKRSPAAALRSGADADAAEEDLVASTTRGSDDLIDGRRRRDADPGLLGGQPEPAADGAVALAADQQGTSTAIATARPRQTVLPGFVGSRPSKRGRVARVRVPQRRTPSGPRTHGGHGPDYSITPSDVGSWTQVEHAVWEAPGQSLVAKVVHMQSVLRRDVELTTLRGSTSATWRLTTRRGSG